MLQSIIIVDPKTELSGKQDSNNLIISPSQTDKGRLRDISIDQVRQLVIWANQTAFLDQPRFIIIEQASHLGLAAQQALLKTLEEPAQDITIIICPQQATDVLPTIRSRCAVLSLNQVSTDQLEAWQLVVTPQTASTTNDLSLSDFLQLSPFQQLDFLATYQKSKKSPQQLLTAWLNQAATALSTQPSASNLAINHHLQQAIDSLAAYTSTRLVFLRLHHNLASS